ncbi:exopolysaccharide Pel transporter PelG [Selenomonas dianae]|uniref:Exopolysaccharide Pel transporter PelG n=1 Tax=Selenomonas dianae TaxID=135079 RepID=A0ABP3CFI7_9FIRM|nr:exopolysaccharide Pel transporter PelG [Selenomonas dianae]WLD82765.1 exopolysaccharide Pel transporter PelG [Selenomonas dianae]
MAGVGFELKRLFRARTAAGHIKAYSYSAIVTTGPFALLTGMVLAIQMLFQVYDAGLDESAVFLGAVVYSFVFSQLLSCGFTIVLTRYLADCLTVQHYRDVTPSMFGMSALLLVLGSIASLLFFWGKPLAVELKVLSHLFFSLLLMVWVGSVYLTAVKKFKYLILGYLSGVLISFGLAALFLHTAWLPPAAGALFAMDVGMGVLVLFFFLYVTSCFGLPRDGMIFAFLPYLGRHGRLFIGSFGYTLGLFLPNIIIWQGPWGVLIHDTFLYAPRYDVVVFYALLSILPLTTMFVVKVETHFYERYAHYFGAITHGGNLHMIEDARKDLLYVMWFELRQAFEFQFVFTLVFLAFGNYVLSFAGLDYNSVNMFNVMIFAAFFSGALQVLMIMLEYFDFQSGVWRIGVIAAGANIVFGILSLWIGEKSYGFGFFLATAIALAYSVWALIRFGRGINYYVFCAQPVFYQANAGIFYTIANFLYGEDLPDLERMEKA